MLTFSTNLAAKSATTQFMNFDFNSLVNFNGRQLATGDGGLYALGGDYDQDEAIDAYFEPVMSDFGISHPKQLRYLYLGFEADGDIEVTVIDDRGRAAAQKVAVSRTGQQLGRITITRALRGRYWTVRVANIFGSDFSIDSMQIRLMRINHGLPQGS